MKRTGFNPADLALALKGERRVLAGFVEAMTPIVQARVARVLMRRQRTVGGRDVRQELADLCQEVFVALFEGGGSTLRSWDQQRGLSLENFVGLVAERQVISILRTGKRSPWTEDPTLCEDLARQADSGDAAVGHALVPSVAAVESEELFDRMFERLTERLSPLGLELFRRLFLEEAEVEEVCASMSMTADAVYAWRSRLGKLARGLRDEILSETRTPVRTPSLEVKHDSR
jgi:DNA-directed RNA polymerase specialized sigma24 family protein